MDQLMKGKKGLVMGLANDHSMAYGISKALHESGAKLAFSYQSDVLLKRIQPIIKNWNEDFLLQCDVSSDESISNLFAEIKKEWGELDFIVHSIAYSDKEELRGRYVNTSRGNFLTAMEISCYSLTAVCREGYKLMTNGGSIITMSYIGAERVMPHYNVMGIAKAALESSVRYLAMDLGEENIRVNGISAGPMKTLAAAGIGDFRYMLKWNEYNSPLKRNITLEDVGKTAVFLLSDLSSGITGDIVYVDSGYHVVGMKSLTAPDLTIQK